MGTIDDLVQARRTFEQGDWAGAGATWAEVDRDELSDDDLDRLAVVNELLGHRDECVEVLQLAYARYEAADATAQAVRTAFRLAMVHSSGGDTAVAAGWTARAERLLDDLDDGGLERGYVTFLRFFRHLGAGEIDLATQCAAEVAACGRRFGDADLSTIGLSALGRIEMYAGKVAAGLALFDEAMAQVVAGGLSPIFAGHAYCTMIEGCQEVSDLGRAAEWTEALSHWCDQQSGMVAFTGQCAVHRGQIMAMRGAYREAIEEFERAIARYTEIGTPISAGQAYAERGEVLRLLGDLPAAEDSYEAATDHGYETQPGLALLWFSQGRLDAASAAIRRLLVEPLGPVQRSRVVPAAIEILESTVDVGELVDELEATARSFGCSALLAKAAHARGRQQLSDTDPAGALPYVRKATGLWAGLDCAYEVARVAVDTARALRLLGDAESAAQTLRTAHATATRLGAQPLLAEIEHELAPAAPPRGLTQREVEVLRLVARGKSNAEIAETLVLSERTVARHLSNIFTKLDVTSRTSAAAFAFEHGLA